jgi:hypothetical protein
MKGARILAGVATFAVACALPSVAFAQIGACPTLLPPPCIVNDPGRIAGIVAEIKEKKAQLENAVEQVQQATTLNGALGMIDSATQAANDPITAIVPPVSTGEQMTFSEAANQLSASLQQHPSTVEGQAAGARDDKLRMRAAAGEGYATALAVKARQTEFDSAYQDLFKRASANATTPGTAPTPGKLPSESEQLRVCRSMGPKPFQDWRTNIVSGGANKADNLEQDWELNSSAKMLLLNAYMLKREVGAARMQLLAMSSINSKIGGGGGDTKYSEAAPAEPITGPRHNIDLGELLDAVKKLMALKGAIDTGKTLLGGIDGVRQTQAEYQQMVQAKNQSQAAVQNLANSDGSKKRVSAASLLAKADSIMQARDRTTWDDPSKRSVTEAAASYAESQLDGMVSGDVSDNWSNLLIQRAEAFKQEAFFRSVNADAIALEQDTRKALADYSATIGVNAGDAAALDAAIRAAEARVNELSGKLSTAPADVVSIRDRVLAEVTGNGQPDGTATP